MVVLMRYLIGSLSLALVVAAIVVGASARPCEGRSRAGHTVQVIEIVAERSGLTTLSRYV